MTANKCSITVSVKVSWWLKLYLKTLYMICFVLGTTPDEQKLKFYIEKGVSFNIKK